MFQEHFSLTVQRVTFYLFIYFSLVLVWTVNFHLFFSYSVKEKLLCSGCGSTALGLCFCRSFLSQSCQAKTWTQVFQCNVSHLIQILMDQMDQSRNYVQLALYELYCKLKSVICFVN